VGCPACGWGGGVPAPAPRPPVRALNGWATAAVFTVAVSALTALVFAFVPLVEVWQAREVASTGGTGPAAVVALTRLGVFALLVLAHLAAWICVLGWLYRAYANLRAFPDVRPEFPVGLALAGWFIPFANLVLPALVVSDLARGSDPPGPAGRRTRLLVWLWWPLYVLSGLVAAVGSGYADDGQLAAVRAALDSGDTVDVGVAGEVFGREVAGLLPGMVLYLFSGVLLVILIHRVTAAQYDRIDLLRQGPAPVLAAPPTLAPPPLAPVAPGPPGPGSVAPTLPGPRQPVDAAAPAFPISAVPATGPDATIGT
jgi:hypothetical protein